MVSFRKSTAVQPKGLRQVFLDRCGSIRSHYRASLVLYFLWALIASASAHGQSRFEATVLQVIDGDTLTLSSGETVRLAGINTPEMARGDRPPEPLAQAARSALESMVGGRTVQVESAPEAVDRHGRMLAYLFLPNGDLVQTQLVKDGLASVVAIAPNDRYLDQLVDAEDQARQNTRGLWGLSFYATRSPADVTGGYQFVSGTVTRIEIGEKWFSLSLTKKLVVLIRREDWQDRFGYAIGALDRAEIAVRGWFAQQKTRATLVLNHPFMLERCGIDLRRLCDSS